MKAILVIDMPKNCEDCQLRERDMEGVYCSIRDEKGYIKKHKGIPSWCPLKPMPMKRRSMVNWLHEDTQTAISTHEVSEYDKGWNDCLDTLLGEEK